MGVNDFLESLVDKQVNWLDDSSDIVISSRIRLARNLKEFPYSTKYTSDDREKISQQIESVLKRISILRDTVFIKIDELSLLDRYFLMERHLVSQDFVKGNNCAVVISPDESISIMINEEDHLRMQSIIAGVKIEEAWNIIDNLDDELSKYLDYAFSSQWGYLTSCPTNLGTGLRVSCMVHLPAIVLTKRINKILELLSKLSLNVRGLFGEGTDIIGSFFQISNQVSLGITEEALCDNLREVIIQIKDQEMSSREYLQKKHKVSLEDSIWRAWGILSNCRLINTKETLQYLSLLRLGVDLGIIKQIERKDINALFIIIQPAHLQKLVGKELEEGERDIVRANILRKRLGGKNV